MKNKQNNEKTLIGWKLKFDAVHSHCDIKIKYNAHFGVQRQRSLNIFRLTFKVFSNKKVNENKTQKVFGEQLRKKTT